MQRNSVSRKKALLLMGMMMVGANSKKIANYLEPNCNTYAADGSCDKCSFRFWMTEEGRCIQVNDQCKHWCDYNGDCTECYLGYALHNGECVLPSAIVEGCNGEEQSSECCEGKHCYEENSCESKNSESTSHHSGEINSCKKCKKHHPGCQQPSGQNTDNCIQYEYVKKVVNQKHKSWFLGCQKVCVKCKHTYYLNCENKCIPNPYKCKRADTDGKCLKCYKGYEPNEKGVCVKMEKPIDHCLEYKYLDTHGKHYLNWFDGCTRICTKCKPEYEWCWDTKVCKRVNNIWRHQSPSKCKSPSQKSHSKKSCSPDSKLSCKSPVKSCKSLSKKSCSPVKSCKSPMSKKSCKSPEKKSCKSLSKKSCSPVKSCKSLSKKSCSPVKSCKSPMSKKSCKSPEKKSCKSLSKKSCSPVKSCKSPSKKSCKSPSQKKSCKSSAKSVKSLKSVKSVKSNKSLGGKGVGILKKVERGQSVKGNLRAASPIKTTGVKVHGIGNTKKEEKVEIRQHARSKSGSKLTGNMGRGVGQNKAGERVVSTQNSGRIEAKQNLRNDKSVGKPQTTNTDTGRIAAKQTKPIEKAQTKTQSTTNAPNGGSIASTDSGRGRAPSIKGKKVESTVSDSSLTGRGRAPSQPIEQKGKGAKGDTSSGRQDQAITKELKGKGQK